MKHASCALAGALILAVSACIGDEFLTTSGTGGEGPSSSSSLTGSSSSSSSVGGTNVSSSVSSSVTTSTSDSSSSVSTSASSSSGGGDGGDATAGTGGDGGSGGSTSANGGGGSTSESSAGGAGGEVTVSSVSSSSSAGGEGGGGVTDPYWRLRWTLQSIVPDGRMGLGGLIDQPSGADTDTGEEPFVDALSNDPCVVNDDTVLELLCNLGELEEGTRLQLQLYMYESDGDFYAYMCDRANVANGECKGEVRLEYVEDGVPTTVSTFSDDENGGTPLPSPWEYFGTGTDFRELVYPSLPQP